VGAVRAAPLFRSTCSRALIESLGSVPLAGALFQGPPLGIGMLTAGLILSIMCSFIAAVMRDVFDPRAGLAEGIGLRSGGDAWEVVWKVVLPHQVGVIGGVQLGLGALSGKRWRSPS